MPSLECSCSHCQFTVHLPDRSFLGRQARCPKCREIFILAYRPTVAMVSAAKLNQLSFSPGKPPADLHPSFPPVSRFHSVSEMALPKMDSFEDNPESIVETLEQNEFLGTMPEFAHLNQDSRQSHDEWREVRRPLQSSTSPVLIGGRYVLPPKLMQLQRLVESSSPEPFPHQRTPIAPLHDNPAVLFAKSPLAQSPASIPASRQNAVATDEIPACCHTHPLPSGSPAVASRWTLPGWRRDPNSPRSSRRVRLAEVRAEIDTPDPTDSSTSLALIAGAAAGASLSAFLGVPEAAATGLIWGLGLLGALARCRIRIRRPDRIRNSRILP